MTCNIYEDLGLPRPAEMLQKAKLVRCVEFAIKQKHLTVAAAARTIGISPKRLDQILSGRFRQERADLLVSWLDLLGHRVVFDSPVAGTQQLGEFHLVPPIVMQ